MQHFLKKPDDIYHSNLNRSSTGGRNGVKGGFPLDTISPACYTRKGLECMSLTNRLHVWNDLKYTLYFVVK